MTVHPFRRRTTDPDNSTGRASDEFDEFDEFDDGFPYDYHEDFAEFDDADESMRRYGSVDRHYRYAHRTVSATVLATLTGIQIPVCQAFHCAFFGLLEQVGDHDGLIATPSLVIAGRRERLAVASDWLDQHPQPDVAALMAAADPDEPASDLDRRITEIIEGHSLDLASAADTNPSLTLGSTPALYERVIDEILDLVLSCRVDEIERLATTAVGLLRRMPASIRPIGGAVLLPLGESAPPWPSVPPMSV